MAHVWTIVLDVLLSLLCKNFLLLQLKGVFIFMFISFLFSFMFISLWWLAKFKSSFERDTDISWRPIEKRICLAYLYSISVISILKELRHKWQFRGSSTWWSVLYVWTSWALVIQIRFSCSPQYYNFAVHIIQVSRSQTAWY